MNSDLVDDELRASLERLAAARVVPARADVTASVRRRARARRQRRRVLTAATLASICAAVLLVVVVISVTRIRESPRTQVAPVGPPSLAALTAGVAVLDAGPLAPRRAAAIADTGRELVVWGGYANVSVDGQTSPSYTDGAAYDPTTRTWRMIATGPLPADNRAPPLAVATGTEVVIARDRDVAAWNPATNTWRALSPAPAPVGDLVDLDGITLISASANATLDLRSGQWHALPTPPIQLDRPQDIWTGHELIVVGQHAGETTPVVLAYHPGNTTWDVLSRPTTLDANAVAFAWNGHEIVAVDYALDAASYDPVTDVWRALPPVPARFYEWYPAFRALPPTVTAFMAHAIAILDKNEQWSALPYTLLGFAPQGLPSAAPATALTGSEDTYFVYGLTDKGTNTLVSVNPTQLETSASQIQVGIATVALPDGAHPGSWTTTVGRTSRVVVDLTTPSGPCQVGSTHAGGEGTTPDELWHADPSRRTWTIHPTPTDIVDVHCDDPTTAHDIATNTRFTP